MITGLLISYPEVLEKNKLKKIRTQKEFGLQINTSFGKLNDLGLLWQHAFLLTGIGNVLTG